MTHDPPTSPDDPAAPGPTLSAGDDAPTADAAAPGVSDAPHGEAPAPEPGQPEIPGYQILGKLGQGGMGVVWRATQESTQRPVALKTTVALAGVSDRAAARFEREVELAARLEHPNIARVYDSGQSRGVHYYAMQLVDGQTLDRYVAQHQPTREQLLVLMRDIALAVQHAHQRGMIHRDLKPANILVRVDEDGRASPVLLDFGLAKPIDLAQGDADARTQMTQQGQVAGTLAYMAPEQAAGQIDKLDTRTDIYALGAILYQLLTGRVPHDVSGPALDVLKRIAESDVPRPRATSKRASQVVDTDLEALLRKCLERDPDRRYDSAAALAADIDHYLDLEPLSARPATTGYFLRKKLSKHRKPLTTAAAVALLLACGGLYATYRQYHKQVYLPIDSTPRGASIVVNGIPRPGCGTTPCGAFLGPGTHTIELVHEGGYWTSPRQVEVQWGQVSASAFEPIVMRPGFRTILFTSDTPGARVELADADTGQIKFTTTTPATLTVPRGRYHMRYLSDAFVTPAPGELMEIIGNATPLEIHRPAG